MTNGWVDIKNTDMMLIMGGNPAENHPCGFKWAIEAKRIRNAKMIVVDPRFTRTASLCAREQSDRQRLSPQLYKCGVHRKGWVQAPGGRRNVFRIRRGEIQLRPVKLELRWNIAGAGSTAGS